MDIRVLDANPLYMDQTYRLRFKFSSNYPIGTVHRPPIAPPMRSLSAPSSNLIVQQL